jgi:trehalose/maltose transport system substrate-binding protein
MLTFRRAFRILRVLLPAALALAGPIPARAVELAIACSAVGREAELCREGAGAWSRASGHAVRFVATPNDAVARFAIYQQLLGAHASELDVLQIDVVWPGALARHLVDLAPHLPPGAREAHLPALIENATIDGRLVALPWFVDVGLLYYRRDLLEKHGAAPPRSWRELTETARRIQRREREAGHASLWGFVFQGRPYEGLTCNALEWIASSGGGRVLGDDGAPTIDNPRAAAALALARSWIGTIAPRGVLNYAEEDARGVFQSGDAVFMRNWPYAWALAQGETSRVRGKVGVTALPSGAPGEPGRGTLGGAALAVSRYSRHPELAAQLVAHLAGAAEQRRRALEGSFAPTVVALYDDPELRQRHPFIADMRAAVAAAVARPVRESEGRYARVSLAFWRSAHAAISGVDEPAEALAALETRLERLRQGVR